MSYRFKKDEKSKHIFLVVSAIVCFLVSSSVIPFLSDAKNFPQPDILLCFVCVLPEFADMKTASAYAITLGFLSDLFITLPFSFSPVVYLLSVLIASRCHTYFARVGSLALAISTLPCILLKLAVSGGASLFTVDGVKISNFSFSSAVMSLILGFACAIVIAFLMRVIFKKLKI